MQIFERGVDEALVINGTIIRVLEVLDQEVRIAISSPNSPRYQEVTLICSREEDAYDFFDLDENEALTSRV